MEDEIRKLSILRDKIMFMKNSKRKALLIKDYYNIVAFLYNAGFISSIDDYDFDADADADELYEAFYLKNVNHFIKEIWDNSAALKEIFQRMIDEYQAYHFKVSACYKKIQVSRSKMKGTLSSFFWNISDETLEIYEKMINERRIYLNISCPCEGLAINTMNTDFAYAVIGNESDDLEYYVSIAHEVGHIYMMYMRRFSPSFINVEITSEIVSLLFEKLFFYFLDINEFLPKENFRAKGLHHSNIFHFAAIAKVIMDLYEEKKIKMIDKDLLTLYPKIPIDEIMKEIQNLTGCVASSRNINLASITYPIGEIVSNYFFFKIIDNHDLGMEELNMFIVNSFNMSLSELINNYMSNHQDNRSYISLFMEEAKKYRKSLF